jgi:hypothetical protein
MAYALTPQNRGVEGKGREPHSHDAVGDLTSNHFRLCRHRLAAGEYRAARNYPSLPGVMPQGQRS